jgi:hypothetical protein
MHLHDKLDNINISKPKADYFSFACLSEANEKENFSLRP